MLCVELKYLTLHDTHLCHWGDMEGNYMGTNCVFPVFSWTWASALLSGCGLWQAGKSHFHFGQAGWCVPSCRWWEGQGRTEKALAEVALLQGNLSQPWQSSAWPQWIFQRSQKVEHKGKSAVISDWTSLFLVSNSTWKNRYWGTLGLINRLTLRACLFSLLNFPAQGLGGILMVFLCTLLLPPYSRTYNE